MILDIDGVTVWFPYDTIYPEQYEYMLSLKRGLDSSGPVVLEMASGTGKTISLLSMITAYQYKFPGRVGKLLYCSRTVVEVEKVVMELKALYDYRLKCLAEDVRVRTLCLAVSSRRNLCINPDIPKAAESLVVDSECLQLTAPWVRDQALVGETKTCPFYEKFREMPPSGLLTEGVYSLADAQEIGKQRGICPYFFVRGMVELASVIVWSYQYLLDPKIADLIGKELSSDSIVVFDEAHNIDNVCIDSLSVSLTTSSLTGAAQAIQRLDLGVARPALEAIDRLEKDYLRLIRGLSHSLAIETPMESVLSVNVLPEDIRAEAVPGSIRKARHFVHFLRRCAEFLKVRILQPQAAPLPPLLLRTQLKAQLQVDAHTLGFLTDRFAVLLNSLHIIDPSYYAVTQMCHFLDLLGTYDEGFAITFDEARTPSGPETFMQLGCLDASLVSASVLKRFRSVVITSGTLSPLDMYPKLLRFTPVISRSIPMSLHRQSIRPMIVTRGSDQVAMSSQYAVRDNPAIVQNFGHLLAELCASVPDGVVCFFPSYEYMQVVVLAWSESGILKNVLGTKLLFVETRNAEECALAVANYKAACDSGRGGLLLGVARGRLSEGVDFTGHYGRAVIVMGVPYQNTESKALQTRVSYLRDQLGIPEQDFLSFDAMRIAAQCVGRAIRSKTDYGLLIFVDKRYHRKEKLSQLPQWVTHALLSSHMNLSTDMAVSVTRRFLLQMAEPIEMADLIGLSLLKAEHVERRERKRREATTARL